MYIPSELREPADKSEQSFAVRQKIYSAYAARQDIFRLPEVLDKLDAILVDIRFAPAVNPVQYNKDYLKLLTKKRYLHVPSLGSRSREGDKPLIHNLALGIKIITELKVNVLLFCPCDNDENCHRHKISREFAGQGKEVIEIDDWSNLFE